MISALKNKRVEGAAEWGLYMVSQEVCICKGREYIPKEYAYFEKKKKSSELPVEDSEEVYDGAKYSLHPEKHKEQFWSKKKRYITLVSVSIEHGVRRLEGSDQLCH